MTATDRESIALGDDPGAVLAVARLARRAEEDQARRVLLAAAAWAAMHAADSVVTAGEWTDGGETMLPLGGAGCPAVAEFCVAELAAALGKSTESGRRYLAGVVELRYRLPFLWRRVETDQVPAWKALAVAEQTMPLSREAAGFVDESLHWCVEKLRPAALARLVDEAIVRFDPETAEQHRREAADQRYFDIGLDQTDFDGTVRVDGQLDYADARDLEAALSRGAAQLKELGSTEPLDVRRSVAAGELARRDLTLDLASGDVGANGVDVPRRPARQVVIHAHVPASVFARPKSSDLARIEEIAGFVSPEQVRLWCGKDVQVTVKPLIDLNDHVSTEAYEIPDRLAEPVDLRDRHCVHPYCTRSARRCDHDHVTAYAQGGRSCTCNVAPLCRAHHRLKTRGGWRYYVLEPGRFLWTSPHDYQFLVDGHGTTDVSRDLRGEINLGDGCLRDAEPPDH